MKKRPYAFLIAAIMLFVPIGVGSHALLTSINPVDDLSAKELPASELSGDTVIRLPDPNFEAAVREIIEKPTGDITADDVAGVAEIDLTGLGIADLAGIEFFAALETLDCFENALTKLDISQNVMLKDLDCGMNQLKTLDVSHNTALTELYCGDNQLITLDLSHNVALKSLGCWYNQLTTLDVSHNTALKLLNCGDNQLMALDVSHNATLEDLYCDGNQLVTLDVSQNPALEELSCQNNLFSDQSAILGLEENRLKRFDFEPQDS